MTNLLLLPYELWILRKGWQVLSADFPNRKAALKAQQNLAPTKIELLMGIWCTINLITNCYLKMDNKTLIFMFNPCHVVNLFLIVISFGRHSRLGEICALMVYSFAFGGWIGIIFNENEGFTNFEHLIYYSEHAFASFLGPVVLSLAGRYNMTSYMKYPLPWFGFILFVLYMRWILMPLSAITWANLNHTLCGLPNDPFFALLDLGKTFYFFSDFYLLFSCLVGNALNWIIVSAALHIFGS